MTSIRRATMALARPIFSHPVLALTLLLIATLAIPAAAYGSSLVHLAGPGGVHMDHRLMLTPAQWAADQRGPTMDQMFPPNGFAMHAPILVWWAVLELLGLIAFPFTFLMLGNLPDRGFVVAKTIGLVLTVYLVWIAVSLGLATYDRGFIWLTVIGLALISLGMAIRMRETLGSFLRLEWKRVLAGELVFLAGFAIFVGLRMWYPDLGHQFSPVSPTDIGSGRMGEKQMEMAFLNAILRSRVFPPLDPFFAHGYINYYYFGFVMVATLCKLTQIMPATAFNLAIATFFAMLVGNSFSVVLALTRRITPGVIAAILVGLIGNLNGAWQLIQDMMQVATVHSDLPFFGGLADVLSGIRQVLFGHAVLAPFDFWGPTRIIPPPGYPIDEFPYFTYLFADLHPHLMAFPLTVAAVAFAVSLLLGSSGGIGRISVSLLLGAVLLGAIEATNPWDFPTYLGVVALGALVGAYAMRRRLHWSLLLRPLAWGVGLGVLAIVLFLPFELSYKTVFTTGVGLVRTIPATAFQGLCNGDPSGCKTAVHEALVTPLRIYLEHFGIFAFLVLSYLVVVLGTRAGGFARWRRWWMTVQFAVYYREHARRLPHAARVAGRMRGRQEPVTDVALTLGVLIVAVGLAAFQYFLLAFLVGIVGCIVLLFARLGRSLPDTQLFTLALILVPIALSIGTQFFYVKDFLDQSGFFRMNTIFKFYNQAWVLYALGSSAGLYFLFAELTPTKRRVAAPVPVLEPAPEPVLVGVGGDAPPPLDTTPPPLQSAETEPAAAEPISGLQRVALFVETHTAWCVALTLLFGASLIYTYAGTVSRETYRTTWLPENSVPFTLDGMAFMKVAYPSDYAGIRWINAHVRGAPVIAEAYSPAGYSWPSRVSMFTGLPDIFNGIHEQTEQRYGDEVDPSSLCSTAPHPDTCFAQVHSRQDDLTTLYNSPNPKDAWRVIQTYGVKYIYVGWTETHCQQADNRPVVCYSHDGLAKFQRMVGHGLEVAQEGYGTTIYRVTRFG